MASFTTLYANSLKPALDSFIEKPTKTSLKNVEQELHKIKWVDSSIYHTRLLIPLILKLQDLPEKDQDLRSGTINCLCFIISNTYIKDIKALKTILFIIIHQVRNCDTATPKPNLSEEIKLATVQCLKESFRRSTSDVLEQIYDKDSSVMLGHIMLTLVEFIEKEKYKKLVITAIQCLLTVFYVHDGADFKDIVLRSQVADTLFIYLPKTATTLCKTSLADDKYGENLKSIAIKSLARILCLLFEQDDEEIQDILYDNRSFQKLLNDLMKPSKGDVAKEKEEDMFSKKPKTPEQLNERYNKMQENGRSSLWISATSKKLNSIFEHMSILRAHTSSQIRKEIAVMCCELLENCGYKLKYNFFILLENVIALSEDEDVVVAELCQNTLKTLQNYKPEYFSIFNENSDMIFDKHLQNLLAIIERCDDNEQYAEFMFLKGFFKNINEKNIEIFFGIPRNIDKFIDCLLAAVKLIKSQDLLGVEYSLRQMNETDRQECKKLPWRQFQNLNSTRCINLVRDLCSLLGSMDDVGYMIYDYLINLLKKENPAMNESLLILIWMTTADDVNYACNRYKLAGLVLTEFIENDYWHLQFMPDKSTRMKQNQPSRWFVDRTPGLYESAIEVRIQDVDPNDDNIVTDRNTVTMFDAKFNVLFTCLVLDTIGHCALFFGLKFKDYVFHCLHKILLKIANSNIMIYKAASFALISIQECLNFNQTSELIEAYTDYISYHLNFLIKRSEETESAMDILCVVLQYSSQNSLPHLENIFDTIRNECGKDRHNKNATAFLRVYNSFILYIGRWQQVADDQINIISNENDILKDSNLFDDWVNVLERRASINEETIEGNKEDSPSQDDANVEISDEAACESSEKPALPRYIGMIKDILNQALKFISSNEPMQQILALDCLINGLPLLKDYEDELLPMAHLIWMPLKEKYRQKEVVILNRCISLLNILATHAKEFISKRTLEDVIPHLKIFLKTSSINSTNSKNIIQHTQEYKLQLKLLTDFPNLVQSLQIDDKPLNEIGEVITLYLAENQPPELQERAVEFFKKLSTYNGPLMYLIVLKKSYLKVFEANVSKILIEFDLL